jgi:hypothetical protein
MLVVPFQAGHLAQLPLQEAQVYLSDWVTDESGKVLEDSPSYTAMVDGDPVAAAGILPQWHGRAIAWAFLSTMGAGQFIGVHRAVKSFLDGCYVQRIEMTVDCDFPEAHRWAEMLGFNMEAERMEAYSLDGRDCALYARVLK